MDLGVLYRNGLATLTKGPVGFAVPLIVGGTLPHLDAPVAGLLAEGGSPCGHAAIHSARRPLVCGHVPRAWRRLCHRREGPYDRPIPQSDGRTPGHHLLLSPGPTLRFLSLGAHSFLSRSIARSKIGTSYVGRVLTQTHDRNIRTRPLCRPLARGRLRILHGLCNPPAPLYRSIVSCRRPVDSLVLVPVPAGSDDERDSGIHTSHDGSGLSLGDRLCLPSHALHNLRLQDGAGVPLGRTGGSRQRSLSGCNPVVTRNDVSGIFWIERRTARRSVLGGGGDLSWSRSDRHRDRDSAHQSICGRTPAGTRLCRGT